MKTNNTLKSIFFAATFMLLSAELSAQTPAYTEFKDDVASKKYESVDTVTVGSRMPYKNPGDPNLKGLTGISSEFKWEFYSGYTQGVVPSTGMLSWTINGGTGTTAASLGADQTNYPNYYTNDEINVTMPSTTGSYSVVTNERMVVSGKPNAGCAGTDTVYHIVVVDKPTVAWPGTGYDDCAPATPADITVPLTLGGFGSWEISYDVYYTAFTSGATQSKVNSSTLTATLGNAGSKPGIYNLVIDKANFANAGKYEVLITKLTDRISRKSLDEINAITGTSMVNTYYTITLYPAPKTQKLQHVKNMP